MAFYAAGILSGRFSHNIDLMIISRIFQGVGLSMFPIAFGIIREILPDKKLAMGQTIFGSTFSGGAVIGIVVGATIIQNFGWQFTFFSIFPVAVALWIIIWRFVHIGNKELPTDLNNISNNKNNNDHLTKYKKNEERSIIQKMDLKGIFALIITIVSFLSGITIMESKDINVNINLIVLFSISLFSLAVFILIEKRSKIPLLDLKLMTSKFFISPVIILMLISMSIFMVYQTIPVMVRSPQPLGFGGDTMDSASCTGSFHDWTIYRDNPVRISTK